MLGAPRPSVAEDEIDWRTGALGVTGGAIGEERVDGLNGIGMLPAEPLEAGGAQDAGAAGGIDAPGADIPGMAPIGAAGNPVGLIPPIAPGIAPGIPPGIAPGIPGEFETGAPNPAGIAPAAGPAGGMLRAGW